MSDRFDEIYDNSSDIMKATISRDEFVVGMKAAKDRMSAVDESLTWHYVPEERIDRRWSSPEAFSFKDMKGNGKRLWIVVHWNSGFRFCGFDHGSDEPGSGIRVVRGCD